MFKNLLWDMQHFFFPSLFLAKHNVLKLFES